MAEADQTEEEVEQTEVKFDPENYSIPQLQEEIDAVDDPEWLEVVLSREKEGKNRAGAKAAIASRFELVTEEQEELEVEEEESEIETDTEEEIEEEEEETEMAQAETAETETVEVDPIDLSISAMNERAGNVEVEEGSELVESVSKRGIDPRERPLTRPDGQGGYEVVSGQRRVLAAQEAGLESIEVDSRDMDDLEARLESTRENFSSSLREDVSVRDRALALWHIHQEMGGDGLPSSGALSEELGASTQTVSKWIEPLRSDWEGTGVDPRTEDSDYDLDQIGEATLGLIRNIDGIQKHQRLELASRVMNNDETQASVQNIKDEVKEGGDLEHYLQTGEFEFESSVEAPESSESDSEATGEVSEEDEGEDTSTTETDSEANEGDTEETSVEVEEEAEEDESVQTFNVTLNYSGTDADLLSQAAEDRDMDVGDLVSQYVEEGLEEDGY